MDIIWINKYMVNDGYILLIMVNIYIYIWILHGIWLMMANNNLVGG